jgi:hypothetical protein
VLLQWTAGPISLNSECPQKASELNGFWQAIPYWGGCAGVGLGFGQPNASTWFAITSPTHHIAGQTCPPDALLRGGEIVPLRIANGKGIRSTVANMPIVCDAYLNGLTIPSR